MNLLRDWIASHPVDSRGLIVAGIAAAAGVTPAAVRHWARGIRTMPPSACLEIETATKLPCESLRPDLEWERDKSGRVTGYRVRLGGKPAQSHACST